MRECWGGFVVLVISDMANEMEIIIGAGVWPAYPNWPNPPPPRQRLVVFANYNTGRWR